MTDDFRRIEYQMRGSPHSHGLYWIENAPEYDEKDLSSVIQCREFIDKFISVENCQDGLMKDLIKLQTHSHSSTCKYKEGKRECRFGYPLPPLPETTIMEPLPKDTPRATRKKLNELYKMIQGDLTARTKSNDTSMTFDEYLTDLNVAIGDYMNGMSINILTSQIYLKTEKHVDMFPLPNQFSTIHLSNYRF